MERRQLTKSRAAIALIVATGMVAALAPVVLPARAWAAVDCAALLASGVDSGSDVDSDGFTDLQECGGIALRDGTVVPVCTGAHTAACVDPNTKDLFVIFAPAATGSLLPGGFNPFVPATVYGVTFNGLARLGVTVHQITPAQAAADRTVTPVSPQKAVQLAESRDTSGSILGFCQWGTPNGLDGCTVYSQRILNFVTTTCAGLAVLTAGGSPSSAGDAALAYAIHVSLHETGHTTGGMTLTYNSSYGGNHYQAASSAGTGGKGTRMEQYVTYSTKGGNCKLFVPTDFDGSLDPPTVTLK